MKLASYILEGAPAWGVIDGDDAIHVSKLLGAKYADLKAVLAAQALADVEKAAASAPRGPASELTWLPVIPNPDKILCVGLNYEKHRKETGRAEVAHPTIFGRYANTQTAHGADIMRPRVSTDLDFEGELALIIGKPGRYISRDDAFSYVVGYSCYNDASVRDWQYHTPQFTPGKNFPGTGAFGPWMMTPDELGELPDLHITTRLNGDVMQEATFSQMIFDIPTIIEYCSSFNQLEAGDVIVTGTPGGVGVKRTPPVWMKPGDTVEVEIERLGILRNGIAAEA